MGFRKSRNPRQQCPNLTGNSHMYPRGEYMSSHITCGCSFLKILYVDKYVNEAHPAVSTN